MSQNSTVNLSVYVDALHRHHRCAELLDALRESAAGGGEVLTFSDNEPLKALEAITARRPNVIALERLFAATSRGAALINRIKADPALAGAEIRVVSHRRLVLASLHAVRPPHRRVRQPQPTRAGSR